MKKTKPVDGRKTLRKLAKAFEGFGKGGQTLTVEANAKAGHEYAKDLKQTIRTTARMQGKNRIRRDDTRRAR